MDDTVTKNNAVICNHIASDQKIQFVNNFIDD